VPNTTIHQNGPVKRFLAFTFYAGHALGGAKDFLADFDSIDEALENILEEPTRYYQIVDSATMEVVKEGLARFKNFDPSEFRWENRLLRPPNSGRR
jgi:hypothetical protein